ncbi:AAA family ATPase [Mucispirillum schaedleri]|uniref:AAA family ATPase n=1 Tax=Mucispirillum schaedleri TaxID=248039 RepID=UPI001F58BFCD|nr:AAA family ATPase [Mucispirillum schaedleri]
MKFTLKNIGLIKNSEIKLDGLTVITGHNNSGKTTVGKALYACIEGANNTQERFNAYKHNFILDIFRDIDYMLDDIINIDIDDSSTEQIESDFIENLYNLYNKVRREKTSNELLNEFYSLIKLIPDELDNIVKNNYTNEDDLKEQQYIVKQIISKINLMSEKLDNYSLEDFQKNYISGTLNLEFSEQIQPVKNKNSDLESNIIITDTDVNIINLSIKNNKVVNDNSECLYPPFKQILLIDNPFILDDLQPNSRSIIFRKLFMQREFDSIDENYNYLVSTGNHNNKLKMVLSSEFYDKDLFKKGLEEKHYVNIENLLNTTISGFIVRKNRGRGFEFKSDEYSLNISNLATGTKLFAIMKMLISKGILDNETMLILDEPESHLHPEWQNIFAELLILLVKDVNCRILLTTHSPNFLLAIEAFMYKYNIVDKCNFYQTQFNDDKESVDYILTEDTDDIYDEFLKYLTDVKLLRDNYI